MVARDVVDGLSIRQLRELPARPAVPSSATSVPIVKLSGFPLDQLCTPLTVQSVSSALTKLFSNW